LFQTKRQQRQKKLEQLTIAEWNSVEGVVRVEWSDEAGEMATALPLPKDAKSIKQLLDDAEVIPAYATELDRRLGLLTKGEVEEHHRFWATTQSKTAVFVSVLSLVIALVSLTVSLATACRHTTTPTAISQPSP
jgi:hypothetical protein